jgi:hypothetical protein
LMRLNCSVPYDRFPSLLEAFRQHTKRTQTEDTQQLEQCARHLQEQNFEDIGAVKDFIRGVCKWGGYASIAIRVCKDNTDAEIQDAFRNATHVLQGPNPEVGAALRAVKHLKQLGVSFASKHLRFLCPRLCPVLDSIISDRMVDPSYPLTIKGYGDFARDCASVARALTNDGIPHPIEERKGEWYAADVEASLYMFLKEWKVA